MFRFLSIWFLSMVVLGSTATAQILDPIKWTTSIEKVCDDPNSDEYYLIFKAKAEDGWYMYSQFMADDGPIPTSITYESTHQKLVGKSKEYTSKPSQKIEKFDELFGIDLIKYKKDFTITQKVTITDLSTPVTGYLEFQTCDDKQCLPPKYVDFNFVAKDAKPCENTGNVEENGTDNNNTEVVENNPDENENSTDIAEVDTITNADTTINTTSVENNTNTPTEANNTGNVDPRSGDIYNPVIEPIKASLEDIKSGKTGQCGTKVVEDTESLWGIFILSFFFGFFALLTPCVFPMVPLTVSYFTKRSKSKSQGIRNALIYSASIIVIYVSLGMLVTIIFGEEALNWLSTDWRPNLFFFILFIAFAISFFGYYEIKLPSSWSNKSDDAADRGGLLGIFFMAFTLALVSFSCTGPLIGTLLVQAADGGRLAPAVGMFGFSLALALPFGLFSLFPGWLNSLPRSGGWMNTVKVVLGFLEVGLAFKFLSKADLTQHWGLVKYETFMAIMVLCSLGIAVYLAGFIRFPHDDKEQKISVPRYGLAAAFLGFAVYLGMGFMVDEKTETYATPPLMSGLAPPACYSYMHPCDCPAGIDECYHDYYDALEVAKRLGKPLMVDFTGYGCENCRKMEDQIWIKDKINAYINEDYVLVSLYVDDRTKLPKVLKTANGDKLRTVGNLWTTFQIVNFKANSQPLYVLMDPRDEQVLNKPVGAEFDEEVYGDFLQCGIDRYNAKN